MDITIILLFFFFNYIICVQTNNKTIDTARILYQNGNSEDDLPICSPLSVCSRVDTYNNAWSLRLCRCANGIQCPSTTDSADGHTVSDKTRQFKSCESVDRLSKCRYFRDITWTVIKYADNVTQQILHCTCPKNSVAYIIKRQAYQSLQGTGFQYSFACSPQSRIRCQRKEPCRLFTSKKLAHHLEDVNSNTLCQCPRGHQCPNHHLEAGVIPNKVYDFESVRTYSAYCM